VRRALLDLLAGSARLQALAESAGTSGMVRRYVAGTNIDEAVRTAAALRDEGAVASLAWLRPSAGDPEMAADAERDYLALVGRVARESLGSADVVLSPGPIGLGLAGGVGVALQHARRICAQARNAAVTVTFAMAGHVYTAEMLRLADDIWADYPDVGVSVQAASRRTEDDCRALSSRRVRLLKGSRGGAGRAVFSRRRDVDRSFVRCMSILMAGDGRPVIATHDPRLVRIAGALARREGRDLASFDVQLRLGVDGQWRRRLVEEGYRVSVFTPFGAHWYPEMVRGLADSPADVGIFVRSLAARAEQGDLGE
jgi:proline dehydrogenase